MSERHFVDTNVLVYASVQVDARRSPIARETLVRLSQDQIVISTQILLEFANVATKHFGVRGPILEQVLQLRNLAEVHDTTPDDIVEAVRLTRQASLSLFDAMIVHAARKTRCSTLYTEDLNNGQVIAGVRIVNPFNQGPTS